MADGLIDMIIQSADFEKLNVKPGDVLDGKIFVGNTGTPQEGIIPDKGSPTFTLQLNSSVTLPEGKYTGGVVKQSIPTMGQLRITPGSKQQTISTKGMYMTGDIIIELLQNLKPENIKLGEYVGGVGPGQFQGYIVTDPNTFYYRGTFGPGQSLTDYPSLDNYGHKAKRTDELKYIKYEADGGILDGRDSVYGVFENPINLTNVNKLIFQYSIYKNTYMNPSNFEFNIYLTYEKNIRYQQINSMKIASSENSFTNKDETESIRTAEIDVSSFSRQAYLSFYIFIGRESYNLKIHSVKFQ